MIIFNIRLMKIVCMIIKCEVDTTLSIFITSSVWMWHSTTQGAIVLPPNGGKGNLCTNERMARLSSCESHAVFCIDNWNLYFINRNHTVIVMSVKVTLITDKVVFHSLSGIQGFQGDVHDSLGKPRGNRRKNRTIKTTHGYKNSIINWKRKIMYLNANWSVLSQSWVVGCGSWVVGRGWSWG